MVPAGTDPRGLTPGPLMALVLDPNRTRLGAAPPVRRGPVGAFRSLFSGPGWPLAALFVLYPLWWALGFAAFAWIAFSVPMVWMLARRRPFKTPPWFAVWLGFLGVVAWASSWWV